MSDKSSSPHPFAAGFDFLKNLSAGQAAPLPGATPWATPSLDPQELDKRIAELKAVQFWLDQNAAALKATIQALEVQKMTLATLKGMNVDLSAMAQAFKFGAPAPQARSTGTARAAKPAPAPEPPKATAANPAAGTSTGTADPMQLWGSLTKQFQDITSNAMQEMSKQAAQAKAFAASTTSGGAAKVKPSSSKTAAGAAVKKPAARKTAKRGSPG